MTERAAGVGLQMEMEMEMEMQMQKVADSRRIEWM
jgi:hypothetical protein